MLNIKIVGSGCANCNKLAALCREIVEEKNIPAEIEKITSVNTFAELGIMLTPGLLLNNKVISSGKIPPRATLTQWILDANQER